MIRQLVVIDGIFLCGPINGINRYSKEVALAIDALENKGNYMFQIVVPKNMKILIPIQSIRIVELDIKKLKIEKNNYKGWTRKCAEPYARQKKAIFLNFSGAVPFRARGYACFHDIRPICFDDKKNFSKSKLFKLKFKINCILAKLFKSKIVTLTEYSKSTIIKYLKIESDNIFVNPCGWEHIIKIKEDKSILDKMPKAIANEYYFVIGSLAPHKNYKWIQMVALKNPQSIFVIAGGKELDVWNDNQQVEMNNIIYTGRISDEEMKALLLNCKMLLFPSLFEGFGLPPLEALSLKKKVAVANTSCLPEVFGNCVSYFEPYDYDVNLDDLYENEVENSDVLLHKYTWHNNALIWMELLDNFNEKGGEDENCIS